MTHRTIIAFLPVLWACSGATDKHTDGPATLAPECAEDGDCGSLSICEDEQCIDGDRDNSIEDATPILLEQTYSGTIFPEEDVDWFSYESPGDEWLVVQTVTDGDPEDSIDTVVSVHAPNGALHHYMDNFNIYRLTSSDTNFVVYLPTAGTWYFKVEDVGTFYEDLLPRWGEDFTYELEVKPYSVHTRETDSTESPSYKLDLENGTTIWRYGVHIETPGDVDHIQIDTPWPGAPLVIDAPREIPGSDARPTVELWKDDVQVLSLDEVGPVGPAMLFDQDEARYDLRLTDALGGGGLDYWYVVYIRTYDVGASDPWFGTVSFRAETEPNDSFSDAEEPQLDHYTPSSGAYDAAFVQGSFEADGDEDWFKVATDPGQTLVVRCWAMDYGSLADLKVEIRDSNDDLIAEASEYDGSPDPDLYEVPTGGGGNFRVRILSENGVYGEGAWYRCGIYRVD